MLKTSEERIKLLKKGFTQKQMEELYIEGNNLKIIHLPILVDLGKIEAKQIRNTCETAVEYAQSLGSVVASMCDVSQFEKLLSHNSATI